MKTRFAICTVALLALAAGLGHSEDQFKRRRAPSDAILRVASADTARDTSWVATLYGVSEIGVEIPWQHGDSILAKFDWTTRGVTTCGIRIGRQFPYDTTWTSYVVDTVPSFAHTFLIYLNSKYPYQAKVDAHLPAADSAIFDERQLLGAVKTNCELTSYDTVRARVDSTSVAIALFPRYFPYCHAAIRAALVSAPTVFHYGFDLNQTADSLDGSHVTIGGLQPESTYYYEWMGWLPGCSLPVEIEDYPWSVSLGTFTMLASGPSCPTVSQSNFATQVISSLYATLHMHTDYAVGAAVRWKKTGGAWGAVASASSDDSVQTTQGITSLDPAQEYKWQMKTKYTGCDSSAWGAEQTFETLCPNNTFSNTFATQNIQPASAVLHFHTSLLRHADFRYHVSPSGAWNYTAHDADADSLQHTVTITGLTYPANWAWQVRFTYNGGSETCAPSDWSAYGDSITFSTVCPTVAKTGIGTKAIDAYNATFTFTSDFTVHGGFRYSLVTPEVWVYRHDADVDSLGSHTISVTGLIPETNYKWQLMTFFAGCPSDTTYGNQQTFQTMMEE